MMKRLFLIVSLLTLFLTSIPFRSVEAQGLSAVAQQVQPPIVTAGICRVKTDMELQWEGSLFVNFHSRTRLSLFKYIPGGITPATIRLQGGKGSIQLTPAWLDFVERINKRNPVIAKYLFHINSGWQNSDQYGRVEQLVFENQNVKVLRVSGNRAYVETFFIHQNQPSSSSTNDPRIQLFTIVTREDQMIGTPKGPAYILLMARPNEVLWIGTQYLDCPSRLPKTANVTTYPSSLNIRSEHKISDNLVGSYASGMAITILETFKDGNQNIWGRTNLGWVALRYNGQYMTDWQV